MGIEIERKYLVTSMDFKEGATAHLIHQGYLSLDPKRIVRVRVTDGQGYLTLKGKMAGFSRLEFEYPIPTTDAAVLLDLCEPSFIQKTRYAIRVARHLWEVDVFRGANEGLVVAEIELKSEDEAFELPSWVGAEVTSDLRYNNANLITNPFCKWGKV